MPRDLSKLAKLDKMMDEFLESRKLHPEPDDDDDCDDPNIETTLAAPKPYQDGEHGGVPTKIHGEEES
jgi:hypothetical protein